MTNQTEKIIEEKGVCLNCHHHKDYHHDNYCEVGNKHYLDHPACQCKEFISLASIELKLEKSLSLQNQKLQKIKEELKKEFGKLHYNIIAYSIIDKIFKENE